MGVGVWCADVWGAVWGCVVRGVGVGVLVWVCGCGCVRGRVCGRVGVWACGWVFFFYF